MGVLDGQQATGSVRARRRWCPGRAGWRLGLPLWLAMGLAWAAPASAPAGLAVPAVPVVPTLPAGGASAQPSVAGAEVANVLSSAQQAWLKRQGPVRLAVEPDYGPFIFTAGPDNRLQGLSLDMLTAVQRRTGLRLQVLQPAPLKTLLGQLRQGQADLVTSLRPTPERSAYLLFTQPYVRVPAILVVRATSPAPLVPVGHPLSPLAGRAVAVGAGYAVETVVKQAHPAVLWHSVSDDVVAMQGVVSGQFEAAVVDAASAAFVRQHHGLQGLRSAGEVGFEYELSFAVRRDWPELHAVLNAGIRAIPVAERRALTERWLAPLDAEAQAPRAPWATRLALVLLCACLVLAAWLVWQHARRTRP